MCDPHHAMRAALWSVTAFVALFVSPAHAQFNIVSTSSDVSQAYLLASVPCAPGGIPTQCTGPFGVNLTSFASASALADLSAQVGALGSGAGLTAVNARVDAVNARVDALNARLDAAMNSFNTQINKAYELSAVAAAMKDAIPNHGDRFAVRINAAGFHGQAAGAIGLSWNLTSNARFSLNYGRGQSQSVVSGGMNFSFK